jgi:hypothetical protein
MMKIGLILVFCCVALSAMWAQPTIVGGTDQIEEATANKWMSASICLCGAAKAQIPNEYEPRKGQHKESWQARLWEVKQLRITMFDAKGREMFSLDSHLNYMAQDVDNQNGQRYKHTDLAWFGQSEGKDLAAGRYFYMLELVDMEGKKCRQSGNILLK